MASASVSELRVVLLGNNWSQRSSVGNLLLDQTVFDGVTEPQHCVRVSGPLQEKKIVVINTPDLLCPATENKLTELIKEIAEACAPGPHVFLLVLQPEDFTEQHKTRLTSVLEKFSDQSFDHSLVLISTPRDETMRVLEKYISQPPLNKIIIKCRYRYIWMNSSEHDLNLTNFKVKELLTKISHIVKENAGEHVNYEVFEDAPPQQTHIIQTAVHQSKQILTLVTGRARKVFQHLSIPVPNRLPQAAVLRIVLFGKSDDKKTKLSNVITKRVATSGVWRRAPVTVVKSPDLLSLSVEAVREEMKRCVSLCSPGPNILLLLVKPSGFTEDKRQTLKFILSLFGPNAFKHSMVILTHDEKGNKCVDELIGDCGGRYSTMLEGDQNMLMKTIESIINKNKGSSLIITEEEIDEDTQKIPSLNLVLCGRRGAEKTSAAEAILGGTAVCAESSSEQCVKHQGEVCGRWVSLVELPALFGKPPEAVMQECLSCISLCGPEGVHGFILVLPVAPLTDEDKAELKTIQDTFSSRVHLFTMILFTVDSDPTAPALVNFVKGDRDIQELCQSCGGGCVFLNIRDKNQVFKVFDIIENIRPKKDSHLTYTAETLMYAQMERLIQQEKHIATLEELQEIKTTVSSDQDKKSPESLRIVLIGKTGSGKSTSGNTILGRESFQSDLCQVSVTKVCQKEQTTVDGHCVAVVDTPGLFDSTLSNEGVIEEMVNCVSLLAPGPHVFLLVLPIGRLTPEEKETLKLIKKGFGKDAGKYTMILFTYGDILEKHKISVDEFIKTKCDDLFKKLVSDCGNRFHVFNNFHEDNHTQVKELIKKIDDMVKENGGGCFTNDMLQEAESAIKKEMERLLKEKEEEMRREMEEMERKYKQEMEEIKIRMKERIEEIEKEREQRENELKEKEEKIKEEQELRKTEQKKREEEDRKRKNQDEIQRQEWEQKRNALEEKIKSEEESKETFDRKLQESSKKLEQEREKWEHERQIWWNERKKENEKSQHEEQRKLKELQGEYEQERENYKIKRLEEDRIRQEQEEKERKELEEKHQKQVEDLKRVNEEKARKKAEEHNEFKKKKQAEMESIINQHIKDVRDLQQQYENEKHDMQKDFKATETTLKEDITEMQNRHKVETGDLVILLLTQKKKNRKEFQTMKKKHGKEFKKCEADVKSKFKQIENKELVKLESKQKDEMQELNLTTNKEGEKQKKIREHDLEKIEITKKLLEQQHSELDTATTELQEKHEQELDEFNQKLLRENEEEIDKLQKKQDLEMKDLKLRLKTQDDGSIREELEKLQKEHDREIKGLKDKLLTPEEKSCFLS